MDDQQKARLVSLIAECVRLVAAAVAGFFGGGAA